MKSVVRCILALGFVLTASTGVADEPKEKRIQCQTKHLDAKWNLKCKSLRYDLPVGNDFGEVRIVFEFTKDVEADTLKRIRKAFEQVGATYVQFCFFDKDNVLISKRRFTSIKGEIRGSVPGVMKCPRNVLIATSKVEPRLAKNEK
jgi:hypothetical protein